MRVSHILTVLVVFWVAFIVYGTTVPFDFDWSSSTAADGWRGAHRVPLQRPGGGLPPIPDLVSNVLLFMPLGFLGVIGMRRRGASILTALFVTSLLGTALSLSVEIVQLWSPLRTTSINDLLTNGFGTLVGAIAGLWLSEAVWPRFQPRLIEELGRRPYGTIAAATAIAVLLSSLAPFDVSIDIDDLKRSVKETRLIPFGPTIMGDPYVPDPLGSLGLVLGWMLVGGVLAQGLRESLPRKRGRSKKIIVGATLSAAGLAGIAELAQLGIVSRSTDTTTVLLATVGAGLGAYLLMRPFRHDLPRALGFGIVVWIASLLLARWFPFRFTVPDPSGFEAQRLLPFLPYFVRTDIRALADILLETGSGIPLGALLAARIPSVRPLKAALGGLALGLVIEGGQLFLAERTADITDAFSLAVGSGLGCWLWHWGVGVWEASSETREADRPHRRRRRSAAPLALLALSAILSSCSRQPTAEDIVEAARDCNVVFILLDAAAAGHFGCYGYERDVTPNIDSLATEGVVFERAYAQASGTMLSVYSYFTSRYPLFETPIDRKTLLQIPDSLTTLAEVMGRRYPHRLGYTANSWLQEELGHGQGFTDFRKIWELELPPELGPVKDYHMLPIASEWMREHAAEGFFAYLHLMRPHSPYDPPAQYTEGLIDGPIRRTVGTASYLERMQGRQPKEGVAESIVALYDGNLRLIDEKVGELFDGLRESGLWDSTVIVVTADHGEAFWENGPLMGHGGLAYEPAIRVPLIVRVPKLPILAGTRVEDLVELVDLLPTLAELTGSEWEDTEAVGRSLLPLMVADGGSTGRSVYSRTNRKTPAIFTIRHGRHKLLRHVGDGRIELYDLEIDPLERDDLAASASSTPILSDLEQGLDEWMRRNAPGGGADVSSTDSLDAKTVERLRAVGYLR